MIKLIWDEGFKRSYKKKAKNNEEWKNNFWKSLKLFSDNPFNPSLKTHKLTGKLRGFWAYSCGYDCRICF